MKHKYIYPRLVLTLKVYICEKQNMCTENLYNCSVVNLCAAFSS